MRKILATALALGLVAATAAAAPGPYAGWQARDIKALSPQEVDDLRAGRGMSLALAAELNGYPGPRHLLDLGDDLALNDTQRQAIGQLFAQMQGEAQRVGADILRREAVLDSAFGSGDLREAELQQHLAVLGALRGELRFVHLRAHITAKALLSAAQVARYNELRGYVAESAPEHGGHDQAPQPHRIH